MFDPTFPCTQTVISRLDPEEIGWLSHQLTYLRRFVRSQLSALGWLRRGRLGRSLDKNDSWIHTSSPETPIESGDQSNLDNALIQRLIEDLDNLLTVILEILGFWRIISDHVVHQLIK